MKMVSAAKYARAERDLKAARPYGVGAQSFYENAQVGRDAEGKVVPAEAGQKSTTSWRRRTRRRRRGRPAGTPSATPTSSPTS